LSALPARPEFTEKLRMRVPYLRKMAARHSPSARLNVSKAANIPTLNGSYDFACLSYTDAGSIAIAVGGFARESSCCFFDKPWCYWHPSWSEVRDKGPASLAEGLTCKRIFVP
jgi:hypothetical protein